MRVSDTMKRTLSLIAASAAVVGIAGCGGGGGGNSGPAAPAVNALRTFMPGDSWKYSVTADIVPTSGPTIHLKDGSYTQAIGNFNGGGLSLTESLSLSYYGGFGVNESNVSNITQSAAGVNQLSDSRETAGNQEGADPFTSSPSTSTAPATYAFLGSQQILPGSFSDTTGIASDDSYGVAVFVPGTPAVPGTTGGAGTPAVPDKYIEKITNQEHTALSVVGKEDIGTPAGKFSTFKCAVSAHYVTQGVTIDGVQWWAPQIGSFVKADLTQNIPTVGTEHLHFVLQTMHLAPVAAIPVVQ